MTPKQLGFSLGGSAREGVTEGVAKDDQKHLFRDAPAELAIVTLCFLDGSCVMAPLREKEDFSILADELLAFGKGSPNLRFEVSRATRDRLALKSYKGVPIVAVANL